MIHLVGQEAWPVQAWVGHFLSAKATTSLRDSQTIGHGPLEAGGRGSSEAGGAGRSSH